MGEAMFRPESPVEYFKELVDGALARQGLVANELTSFYVVHLLAGFIERRKAEEADATPLGIQLARALDSAGAELRIPRAGEATNERGRAVYASLLDVDTSRAAADDGLAVSTNSRGATNSDLLPWIVLLAIALLLVEWWLVRAERIP